MTSILFVCTGNICRSPTAEAVFRHKVISRGLGEGFMIDSAGTHGYHIGENPDSRSVATALGRGVDMQDLVVRKVLKRDFETFDLLLAMDRGHYRHLESMRPASGRARLSLFLDFHPQFRGGDVPDPYYGGQAGFDRVFDMIDETSEYLLENLLKQK